MIRALLVTLLLFAFTITQAQKQKRKTKEDFYIFKADWQPASSMKDAAYFARFRQVSDTCWQWNVYNLMGPLIKSENYRDAEQKQLHGTQQYFKPSGYMDSTGLIVEGRQHDDWMYYADSGQAVLKKEFFHGQLIKSTAITKDTVKTKDTLDRDEIESRFPGGADGWRRYLLKNLRYPDRALKGNIKGLVVVQFVIDTLGKAQHPEIFKSVEFSIDEETLRLIEDCPKWVPASQKGRLVKSYKRQPIHFTYK